MKPLWFSRNMPSSCSRWELSYRGRCNIKPVWNCTVLPGFSSSKTLKLRVREKVTSEGLVQIKQRMPWKEAQLGSALLYIEQRHRPIWKKNKKYTSAPEDSRSGEKEKQSTVQFDSNSKTFEVCCSEMVHNEAISTTTLKSCMGQEQIKSHSTRTIALEEPSELLLKCLQRTWQHSISARLMPG